MKLLDTMVIVYARTPKSRFHTWAKETIAAAVMADGAAINTVSLAELCSEEGVDSTEVVAALNGFGVAVEDLPAGCAGLCGAAYREYRRKRKAESGKEAPRVPLPDFFIGAHAEYAGWQLVTNDPDRYRTYFPQVGLEVPN